MKLRYLFITAALSLCASWRSHAQARPDRPGAYAVGHITSYGTDTTRARTLRYDVWYPATTTAAAAKPVTKYEADDYFFQGYPIPIPSPLAHEGPAGAAPGAPFPLILYSHSANNTRRESYDLCELLASHGYVVFSADHKGASWPGDPDPFAGNETNPISILENRAPDLKFLIDTALARNSKTGDLLRDRIDPAHIGALGYSYGGFSVAALGCGYHNSAPDPRLDSMVLLSYSAFLFTPADFARFRGSVLGIVGTDDSGLTGMEEAFPSYSGPRALVKLLHAQHIVSFDANHEVIEWLRANSADPVVLSYLPAVPFSPAYCSSPSSSFSIPRLSSLCTRRGIATVG